MLAVRHALRVLARRALILPLTIVGVTAIVALLLQGSGGRDWTAEAVVLVGPGAEDNNPGQAQQAVELATTYTAAIPQDDGAIAAVAQSVGRSRDDVADRIVAVGTTDTSVISLLYRDSSEEKALVGATALSSAVIGARPAAFGVDPNVLRTVRRPRIKEAGQSGTAPETLVIGAFLGLVLGIVLIIGWERSNPRIDRVDELADESASPATSVSSITPASIGPLLDRWVELARPSGDRTTVVAVLAGTPDSADDVPALVDLLVDASRHTGHLVIDREHHEISPHDRDVIELIPGGMPGGEQAGESVARSADLVLVAVRAGAAASEVGQAVRVLEEYGARPGWALMYTRKALIGASRPRLRGVSDAPQQDDDVEMPSSLRR